MQTRKTIFFTIEIKDRELISKCLLAYELLKRNFRVYIGTFDNIHRIVKKYSSGIIFHKSTYIAKSSYYKRIGHVFVFLDEEGGITIPRSKLYEFCVKRYGVVSKELNDIIFLPGKKFTEIVSQMPNIEGVKLYTTGWPRIDLCREKYSHIFIDQVNKIRKKHGNFYLFITSFGMTSEKSFNDRIQSSTTEFEKKYRMHKYKHFKLYIDLMKCLSDKLDDSEKIIIRPHPSESIEDWKMIVAGLNNIIIVREGDISPWILAAEAIIQYGSTSSVQAAMSGIKSIQYKIEFEEGITDTATFELSYNANSPEEVYRMLRAKRGKKDIDIQKKVINILENEMEFDSNETAASKISKLISDVDIKKLIRVKLNCIDKLIAWRAYWGNVRNHIINDFYRTNEIKRTRLEKVPKGINKKEVKNLLDKFSQIDKNGSDFFIEQSCKDLICIEPLER